MRVNRLLGNCPGCGGIDKYGNVYVRDNRILRGCSQCRYSKTVLLPSVHKKVLYLDQFFFSSAFKARDARFVQAAKRIGHLSALQLLAVPYSSVHEDETHQWRGYEGQDKDDLMKFIKDTSGGHKFEPAWRVEQTQVCKGFNAFRTDAPSVYDLQHKDAFPDAIHGWDDYVWIDVGQYYVDIELMRELNQEAVEELVKAFENWRQATHTFEEHVAIELRQAANNYITTYSGYAARLLSGDDSAVFNAPLLSQIVESLLTILPPERIEERLKKVVRYFKSEHFSTLPYHWVTSRVYASIQGMVARGAYQNCDEAIDRLSGIFQDIKHVAIYAPYCDAFFMDKAMAQIVSEPRINLESRYGVKIFSLNNWNRFLAWLDQLEASMSQEHRMALAEAYPNGEPENSSGRVC